MGFGTGTRFFGMVCVRDVSLIHQLATPSRCSSSSSETPLVSGYIVATMMTSISIMAAKKKNGVALDFFASTGKVADMSAFITQSVDVPIV